MSGADLSAAYQPMLKLSSPGPYDAPMKRALLLCALYGSTIVALYWIGIQPVVP
jgi:hypothetical protein